MESPSSFGVEEPTPFFSVRLAPNGEMVLTSGADSRIKLMRLPLFRPF
jgi:hypothetical protein